MPPSIPANVRVTRRQHGGKADAGGAKIDPCASERESAMISG